MSHDKNSPQFTLGTILEAPHPRDAIHIAVMSVIANERIVAGTPIAFVKGSKQFVEWSEEPIGIVDPFLQHPVEKNQRFWMMLMPNSIATLRHEWHHEGIDGPLDNAESQKWMAEFAGQYGWTAQAMIEAGSNWIDHQDYACDGGTFEGEHVPEEYWDHWEKLTGRKAKGSLRESFFTCSC